MFTALFISRFPALGTHSDRKHGHGDMDTVTRTHGHGFPGFSVKDTSPDRDRTVVHGHRDKDTDTDTTERKPYLEPCLRGITLRTVVSSLLSQNGPVP